MSALVLFSLIAPGAWAQSQPPVASNAQDEQVNILVSPPDTGEVSQLSILRTDEFTDQNDYISRYFQLQSEAMEFLPYVRAIVEREGGVARTWLYNDPATGLQSHYIQVVCPPYQMESVEQIIETMNRPGTTSCPGGTRLHFRCRHQLASHLAEVLERSEVSPDGFVRADDVTNTIYIFDSASDAARVLAVCQYYDVPGRMVELQVQIVEVDLSDSETLGLDWDAWKTSAAGFLQTTSASRAGLGGEFFSFDTLLNVDITAVAEFLNYLVHVGHATTVTNTALTVVNGQTALLESSRDIPFQQYATRVGADPIHVVDEIDTSDPQHLDTDATVVGGPGLRRDLVDVLTEEEGFTLSFTPIIGIDSMVCRVQCEINSLAGQSDLDRPILSHHSTDTMIGLADGGTCLAGAFDRYTTMSVQDGWPVLRHIPGIGPTLFAETTEELRHSKLVVLVTPRIDEHLTYTPEAILNGRRVDRPEYEPYNSPPCMTPPAQWAEAADEANGEIEAGVVDSETEWR